MTRKFALIIYLAGIMILTAGLSLWTSSTAHAQCGDTPQKSSCIACHEKEDPVYQNGEWHAIHALKDCCTNCHGGNCRMMEKDLAHERLVAHPLDDIYSNCYQCHPFDYQERAARFGALLGVIPASRLTPTPVPAGTVEGLPIVILPEKLPSQASAFSWAFLWGGILLATTILISLGLLINHLRAQV